MGVWIEIRIAENDIDKIMPVTPFVGVWIEIAKNIVELTSSWSLPSWECGLKFLIKLHGVQYITVTPFVGVWIEIFDGTHHGAAASVTPFVGVWIEIS